METQSPSTSTIPLARDPVVFVDSTGTDERGRPIATVETTEDVLAAGSVLEVEETIVNDSAFASSLVLDVTLRSARGEAIQPDGEIEICFTPNDGVDTDEACLGTEAEDGEWVCVDCVRTKNDRLCGSTDHLSFYALLDISAGGQKGECTSQSSSGFITGVGWGDAVLLVSVTAAVLCVGIIIIVIITLFPKIHGKEYARIRTARTSRIASE